MPMVEAEMAAFLGRLFPDFEQQCVGATTEQIERLERIAGHRHGRNLEYYILGAHEPDGASALLAY